MNSEIFIYRQELCLDIMVSDEIDRLKLYTKVQP